MSRFLITGTGRSGTKWMASELQARGIACGHQAVFRHEHTLGRPHRWQHWQGDCSFEAVPMLPDIRSELARVVLVTRHCEDMVRSWLRLGAFGDDHRDNDKFLLWGIVLDKHFPGVLEEPTPEARARAYWHRWNASAREYCDVEFVLETLEIDTLIGALRL